MGPKQRESHGGAYAARGRFYMRVTVAARKRHAEALPWVTAEQWTAHGTGEPCPCVGCVRARTVQAWVNRLREVGKTDWIEKLVEVAAGADEATMEELAGAVDGIVGGEIVKAKPPAVAVSGPTFESFAMQWCRGELAAAFPDYVERKRSAYTDLCYLRKYAFPVVGPKPIAEVTLADFEQVLAELAERAKPRKLTRATRRHVAQVFRRVMQLAEYPAKLVERNPVPSNALPRVKTDVALVFVYPEEDAILMREQAVDLGHRFLLGFLHRIGWRREEALGGKVEVVDDAIEAEDDALEEVPALTWGRVDTRRRVILPARNKTNDVELIPLDEDLARALDAWRSLVPASGPDDPVFVDAAGGAIAPQAASDAYRPSLQAALQRAGQDRPELWGGGFRRRALRLHDSRASMVTVALRAGKGEDWVRRRTKHKSSALERYRRATASLAELDLGFWTPLDVAIPELAEAAARGGCGGREGPSTSAGQGSKSANVRGAKSTGRLVVPVVAGSNPVTHPADIASEESESAPPMRDPAAASAAANAAATAELRLLVSELRAVVADLRADNRRLREELGQRAAAVIPIDTRRRR